MSQRSASSCTRCTGANAFPALIYCLCHKMQSLIPMSIYNILSCTLLILQTLPNSFGLFIRMISYFQILHMCCNYYSLTVSHLWYKYRIVASSIPSRIEAHADLFRLLMKGIFDPYVLWPFDKKSIFLLVKRVSTRDFTVCIGKMDEVDLTTWLEF